MKLFTLCVVLVTLLYFFLNTLETEGQLTFNLPGLPLRKTGRSLDQENARNTIPIDDSPMEQKRVDIVIEQPEEKGHKVTRSRPKFFGCV